MKRLIQAICALCVKYREMILYLFFGGCTTVVNLVCYYILYRYCTDSAALATFLAWVAAVLFAYVTNKRFVFESKATQLSDTVAELVSFFGFRLLTGVLDVAIMAVAVDWLQWNGLLWKLISNVIVTVLNYVASKFFIFRKKKD